MSKQALPWSWLAIIAVVFVAAYGLGVGQSASHAQKVPQVAKDMLPVGSVGLQTAAAWTIYLDGGEAKSGARNLNMLHTVMAQKGWELVDIDPRYENSDLKGHFATYRPASH